MKLAGSLSYRAPPTTMKLGASRVATLGERSTIFVRFASTGMDILLFMI
jgi:hypothetical protein